MCRMYTLSFPSVCRFLREGTSEGSGSHDAEAAVHCVEKERGRQPVKSASPDATYLHQPPHPHQHINPTVDKQTQRTIERLPRDGPGAVAGQETSGMAHVPDGGGAAQGGAGLGFFAEFLR